MDQIKINTKKQVEAIYKDEILKHKESNSKLRNNINEVSNKFSVLRSELMNKKNEILNLEEKNRFYKQKLDVSAVMKTFENQAKASANGESGEKNLRSKYN